MVKERARLAFLGGPLDGSVEDRDEAPLVVVWRVAAEEPEGEEWHCLIHRYRRGTDCGKGGGRRFWTYVHEGSVLA